MAQAGWRLTRLISELGIKGGREFDVLPAVQPVLPVGTIGSGLTYPLLAPRGLAGQFFLVPTTCAQFELKAQADGGAIIRRVTLSNGSVANTQLFAFRTGQTSILTSPSPGTVNPVGSTVPRATFEYDDAPVPAGSGYYSYVAPSDSFTFDLAIHIENGWYWSCWLQTGANGPVAVSIEFEDVTVQEPIR